MAYDRKDAGFSYLDDIPLKVGSSFVPPPPVVLPPLLLSSNEELYFEKFQYDFSLENKVLANIQEREVVSKLDPDTATNSSVKPCVQNMLSPQSDILLPKPKEILDKVSSTDDQNNPKINFSDFENDTSSPFDYVLLQSLNDIEELYNVFGANNKSNSDNNVNKNKTSDSGGLGDHNVGSNFSKSMSFPLQNNDSGFENTESFLKCTADRDHSVWSASLTLPKESNSFVPYHHISDASTENSLSRTLKSSVLPEVPFLPSAVRSSIVGSGFQEAASQSSLRGFKSYSDIHNLSEHSAKVSGLQGRSSTPPTSVYSRVQDSLSVQVSKASSPSDANCDNSPASGLLDPYEELPEDSRRFVDAVTDMGFPRAQVSQAVKHLGTDEMTVVEHLCQIQSLEESGYDHFKAEAALQSA